MKWKETKPSTGQTRAIKKFAWWPIQCENGFKVWLEYYESNQIYRNWNNKDSYGWRWVTYKRYALNGPNG